MLTIGISWLYITLLCGGMGWCVMQGTGRLLGNGGEERDAVPLSLLPFLGLALVSVLTAVISIFAPVCWKWNLVFLGLLCLGIILCGKKDFSALCHRCFEALRKWPVCLFLAGCGIILLLKSACVVDLYGMGESVFHSDTGYYHAQSIRWIEEYGVVPGLGNLLSPLAVDYLWFQPCALFSFSAFLPQRLHAMGGLLVLWAMFYAAGGMGRIVSQSDSSSKFSDIYRGMLLLPLFEIGNYVVSDSGDDPAAVMVLVSLGTTLRYLESYRSASLTSTVATRDGRSSLLLLASVLLLLFTVVIKLSTLPLLLLVALLAFSLIRQREWLKVGALFLICTFVLAPKITRTVILSGYPLYPCASLDPFPCDWKMPSAVVIAEKAAVASMARIRFAKPGVSLNGGMEVWFYPWLLKFVQAPVVIALIMSMMVFLIGAVFLRKSLIRKMATFWEVYLVVALGLAYWFIMAPDVRFGFGFLSSASLLLCVPVFCHAAESRSSWSKAPVAKPLLVVLGLLFLAGMFFTTPRPMPGDSFGRGVVFSQYYPLRIKRLLCGQDDRTRFLVFQDPYPLPEMLRLNLGALAINRPKRGMHCWDAPLPATPYLYSRIEMRGDSLKQGFRPCAGPIDGFSGFRLQEEWKEQQTKAGKSSK